MSGVPWSVKQTLHEIIPHSVIRSLLVTQSVHASVHESQLYEERTQYSFGLGILLLTCKRGQYQAVLDAFGIIESSHEQVAILKLNSYALQFLFPGDVL